MPPSGHSRSSHSSSRSSHSSSRSSSRSHSSSSRSHSSSSHSSSYRSSRSSSSGSSTYRKTQPLRTRSHQPSNYRYGSSHPTSTYQCRKHDYIFYPVAWNDESTNTTYQKGYYDEQGNRYDNLILKNNQKYENVPMHCEYCDTTQVRDLTDDTETMACPHCGANMTIDAILDERADVTSADSLYTSGSNPAIPVKRNRKTLIITLAIIGGIYILPVLFYSTIGAVFGPLLKIRKMLNYAQNNRTNTVQQTTQQTTQPTTSATQPDVSVPDYISNVDIFGHELYLKSSEDGMVISDFSDYDLNLTWSDYDESYYDADSDCYVWFNTDMDPSLWQYWYEGISSNYEDSGWMEFENGNWYIETKSGNWEQIDLSGYGDRIWHFSDAYASDYWEN